jgi:hypothetical protein
MLLCMALSIWFFPATWSGKLISYLNRPLMILSCWWRESTFYPMPYRYRHFVQAVSRVENALRLGRVSEVGPLPRYKFYSELIQQLVLLNRQWGAEVSGHLKNLKKEIQNDYLSSRKLGQIKNSAWIQMVLICMVTWGFVYACSQVVENQGAFYLPMAGLQLSGFFIFYWLEKGIFHRYFRALAGYYREMMVINALYGTGLPFKKILEQCELGDLFASDKRFEQEIQDGLSTILHKVMDLGLSAREDLDNLLDHVRQEIQLRTELYRKRMEVFKFGVLALFFLSSYLLYMLSLFDSFLIE